LTSRRRHTRLVSDWSSDVCSSDLAAARDKELKAIVVTGAGANFSSGGDVFEIIGPLVEMETVDLLEFTRMTGEVVKAMRSCPQRSEERRVGKGWRGGWGRYEWKCE